MAIALIYLRPGLYSSFIDPVSCPRCGGFGVYSHPFNECESVDCSDCDGSGVVENPAPSDPIPVEFTVGAGAGGQPPRLAPAYFYCVDCPTCAGWGRVPESGYASAPFDRPCPTCWGRGFGAGRVPIASVPAGSPLIPFSAQFRSELFVPRMGDDDDIPF